MNTQTINEIRESFKQDLESGLVPEELRIKYLGRKGLIADLFQQMKEIEDPEEKKAFGESVNTLKQELAEQLPQEPTEDQDKAAFNIAPPSLDQLQMEMGHISPVTATIFHLQELFENLGFSVATGPELEEEKYNFDALNIPDNHPARDVWDTIWVTTEEGQKNLLRTHTSPTQIRYMEQHKPPIRMIVPGKVYRYEATDATHETSFHQVEGLMIDTNTSIATFKGVMQEVFSRLFEQSVEIRLRPSYFPFTEPSFEIDIKFEGDWLEIAGAGMVHPNVLKAGGIEDEAIQGFAFGMGVERLVMLLTGLNDIRYIHSGDLRFAHQFGLKRTK